MPLIVLFMDGMGVIVLEILKPASEMAVTDLGAAWVDTQIDSSMV